MLTLWFMVVGKVQRLLGSSATWCEGHREVQQQDRNLGRRGSRGCEDGCVNCGIKYERNKMQFRQDASEASPSPSPKV